VSLIGDTSSAVRASRSISTERMRASAKDDIGGFRGIVCVLPSVVCMVMEEREMSVMVAPWAELVESLL